MALEIQQIACNILVTSNFLTTAAVQVQWILRFYHLSKLGWAEMMELTRKVNKRHEVFEITGVERAA